jgi:hypothetical protein
VRCVDCDTSRQEPECSNLSWEVKAFEFVELVSRLGDVVYVRQFSREED